MQPEVWQWSVAKRGLLSGSFAGRRRICMEMVSSDNYSCGITSNLLREGGPPIYQETDVGHDTSNSRSA
jgi:hypothetical protein